MTGTKFRQCLGSTFWETKICKICLFAALGCPRAHGFPFHLGVFPCRICEARRSPLHRPVIVRGTLKPFYSNGTARLGSCGEKTRVPLFCNGPVKIQSGRWMISWSMTVPPCTLQEFATCFAAVVEWGSGNALLVPGGLLSSAHIFVSKSLFHLRAVCWLRWISCRIRLFLAENITSKSGNRTLMVASLFHLPPFAITHFQKKKKWKLKKLEFVKGTINESGRRPIFTIKVYPFCFFSAGCHHSSHPNAEGEGGSCRGGGGLAEGRGSGRGGGGSGRGEGIWQRGRGSSRWEGEGLAEWGSTRRGVTFQSVDRRTHECYWFLSR